MTSVITAFSSRLLRGKEAEKLIKSGIIQETIEKVTINMSLLNSIMIFWCTIENNGKKTCVLY